MLAVYDGSVLACRALELAQTLRYNLTCRMFGLTIVAAAGGCRDRLVSGMEGQGAAPVEGKVGGRDRGVIWRSPVFYHEQNPGYRPVGEDRTSAHDRMYGHRQVHEERPNGKRGSHG